MAKRMADSNSWVRTFEVTEPTRHRKGFTVYKVTSVVFPRSFPETATKITVWKRYSEFSKLHKELELIFKQLYLKGEFPIFPKAKVFGRFEHEVVEERRQAALTLMEFTANFTQLFTSKPFMQFFEHGYSSQDFMGKILFSNGDSGEDPPATVLQEKSEIDVPCLKPEILWDANDCLSKDADTVSLSPSSISSSISPTETSEGTLQTCNKSIPCSSTSLPCDLVSKQVNETSSVPITPNVESNCSVDTIQETISNTKNSSAQSSHSTEHSNSTALKINQTQRANGIIRSATVTDELSSYFDEEFEDAAFLFPTGSCSSLDTLPGFTPGSETADSTQKETPSTTRGLFTLPRRKTSGFGFFDFLPLFPKKSSKKSTDKVKEEKKEPEQSEIKKTSLSVGYICEAAGHFAVAQFHESNADYDTAFTAYKEGIRVLLAGAQDDTDRDRKLLAKNKLEKYLARAESIKETFLLPGTSNCSNGSISPVFSSPSKKSLSALTRLGKNSRQQNGKSLLCSVEELKPYKVIGIGPTKSKILIVMNPEETSPKCYATKVLWKSSCLIYPEKPTVIPCHIPFMVKLLKWFNTSDKIILLLEHAGGGRLEDFVKNYQSKKLSVYSPPNETSPIENAGTLTTDAHNTNEDLRTCSQVLKSIIGATAVAENNNNKNDSEDIFRLNSQENVISDNDVSSENEVFSTPAPSPPTGENSNVNNPTVLDVGELLENSKALLQTVSKTLEAESSPKKPTVCNIKKNKSMENVSTTAENAPDPNSLVVSDDKVLSKEKCQEGCDLNGTLNLGQQKSRNNSDTFETGDDIQVLKRMVPEGVIRVWTAEIVIALEALHNVGVTYGDLQIKDILLGENGHILLRYKSLWTEIDDKIAWNSYTAPEIRDAIGTPLWKVHHSADWWSLGAILFFLLTGQSLYAAHPEGIYPEMIIKVPDTSVCDTSISKSAKTLMKELLQYSPEIRLGYYGAAEIKTHPFFEGFDWEKAIEDENVFQTA